MILSAGASIGLIASEKTISKETTNEKVKMLTAEGKLVEIDKSVFDEAGKKRASDKEVFNWMASKHKK